MTRYNEILWDGEFINMGELVVKAKAATDEDPRPGLIFAPDGDANYDLSAKVLNLLKRTGVTESRFCLGGLAAHRHFGRGQSTPLLFITIYMPEYERFDPGTPATPPQCDPPVG